MAPPVDCRNYRQIGGQWYQKTPGGGLYPIAANKVPPECKRGGLAAAATHEIIAPSEAAKWEKPKRKTTQKKKALAARGPKKAKASTRASKKPKAAIRERKKR